ncbi:MAG: hypothetical protein IJV99_01100 [Clostridia bacterium]|nr:hypothetical protein [Clostridia bacterium]
MRKKVKNDDVAKVIKDCAEELEKEIDKDLFLAKQEVEMAEAAFVDTLTDKQSQLYDEYLQIKQKYIDLYTEISKLKKN